MITYEYKFIDLSLLGGSASVIDAFNEQGGIGWELVSVVGGVGYFKRSSNNGFDSTTVSVSAGEDRTTKASNWKTPQRRPTSRGFVSRRFYNAFT